MTKPMRIIIATTAALASTLVSPLPVSTEAGCHLVRKFWYNSERDAVAGIHMYVCSDPERGHDNLVTSASTTRTPASPN